MRKITGTFPSTSGLCRCRYYMYLPEKPRAAVQQDAAMLPPKPGTDAGHIRAAVQQDAAMLPPKPGTDAGHIRAAVLQDAAMLPPKPGTDAGHIRAAVLLSHGMCEYIRRYRPFAEFLCDNGIALVGNDHIGHGASVTGEDMLGYFGESGGFMYMVKDLHRMKLIMEEKLPGIPHFLLGHSMGSFIARIYLSRYEDRWNGAVIMGTAGGVTGSAPLRRLLEILCHSMDSRFRPEISKKLAFGLFNIRCRNRRTPNDWLSRVDSNVDRFNADPLCNFTFTVAGFRDLLNALMCANSYCVIENTPTDLPMLFMSGSMDPVGEYGNGVRAACMKYLEHGCRVNIHIYPGARHELLFELNRDEVMEDILNFLDENM